MEKPLGNLLPWPPASTHVWFDIRWIWAAALLLLLYMASGAVSQETNPAVTSAVGSELSENRISLQAARQAYWQGRLDDAVQIYQTLVKQAPGDPNALGELGNVYWQQGKQDAAFEVYFAAAHQLYLQKKQQQAWDLLTFVSLAQWLQQGSAGELLCQNIKKQ